MPYRKYLIEHQSPIMSTTNVLANIAKYEEMPFDGMTINALFTSGQVSGNQPVANWNWSDYAIDWPSLSASLTALLTTPFRKFSQNFLQIKVVSFSQYELCDWYSANIKTAIWNCRILARFAKEAGLRGILWDLEPENTTGHKLFNYSDRPYAGTYTFDQYKAKVKLVAEECMEAMQEEFPNMVLIPTFSYEQAIKTNNPPISTDNYGLLAPFIDGIFNAATGLVEIHNYYEDGYAHFTNAQIAADIVVQDNPAATVYDTNRYFGRYNRGMSSFVDQLGDTNLGIALPKSVNQVAYKYSFVYCVANSFFTTGGAPTQPASTIAVVQNARITTGMETTFSPAAIPGLIMDFDPNTMGLNNGDPITSYTDSTGLVFTQSGANRPTFATNGIATGKPGVTFTAASNQNLVMDGLVSRLIGAADIGLTVIMVVKLNTLGVTYSFMGIGRDATTNPNIQMSQLSTNNYSFAVVDNSASSVVNTGTTTTDTNAHIISFITSGTVLNMRQDGANILATNPYAGSDVGTMTLNRARLGSSATNVINQFANATIGRVIVYDRAVGMDSIRWLELGLSVQTGITVAGT